MVVEYANYLADRGHNVSLWYNIINTVFTIHPLIKLTKIPLPTKLGTVIWYYQHPSLKFLQGDILKLPFPSDHYDLIINCSSIEHVGLAGRYGVTEPRPDGDIEAMAILKNFLKPGKVMLLTIPVGRDEVFDPLHRVYGQDRLPRLVEGWKVQKSEFWVKDLLNRWIMVKKSVALTIKPVKHYYGLGLFVLTRPENNDDYSSK